MKTLCKILGWLAMLWLIGIIVLSILPTLES